MSSVGPIYPTAKTLVYTSAMISAIHQEHNLQAMVELQYMRIGSEVMNSALSKLDEALSITQGSLDQLASLQNLHNQIAVTANAPFPLNFTNNTLSQVVTIKTATGTVVSTTQYVVTTPTGTHLTVGTVPTYNTTTLTTTLYTVRAGNQGDFVFAYQQLASTYYGVPIKPFFHVSLPATDTDPAYSTDIITGAEPAYLAFKAMMLSARTGVSALIIKLTAITKAGDKTTLLDKLKTVLGDMPSANASFSTFRAWALDNYGGTAGSAITLAGKFQQHLTNAITAAESTNTSQNEAVRRYMFVFEQYCQSASAILTQLNQLFEKISRGIAG